MTLAHQLDEAVISVGGPKSIEEAVKIAGVELEKLLELFEENEKFKPLINALDKEEEMLLAHAKLFFALGIMAERNHHAKTKYN